MVWRCATLIAGTRFCATVITVCCAILLLPPTAQAAPPSETPQTAAVAQRIWNTLLTHCGDSYFYAGSFLDRGGMLSDVQMSSPRLLQFRGVTFHLLPIRVTDAEHANGISYRGRVTMIAHLYREDAGPWQDGPDLQRRNIDDMVGRVLADANGELFGMGGGGAMAIQIVKFKGSWALARGSTDFSGSFGAGGGFQFLDDFLKARAPRYSCKDAKVVPPPPTAEEIAAKKVSDEHATAAARAAADAEATERREAAEAKADEARADAARIAREQKLAPWRIEAASVADFMTALRANLGKRAAEYGFSVGSFEPELRQIKTIAEACIKETPVRWKGAQNYLADELQHRRTPMLDPRVGVRNFLHGCDGGNEIANFGERISPKDKPYGLGIARSMSTFDPDTSRRMPTPYVTITVALFLKPEDWKAIPNLDMDDMPLHNQVIEARIPLLSREGL